MAETETDESWAEIPGEVIARIFAMLLGIDVENEEEPEDEREHHWLAALLGVLLLAAVFHGED